MLATTSFPAEHVREVAEGVDVYFGGSWELAMVDCCTDELTNGGRSRLILILMEHVWFWVAFIQEQHYFGVLRSRGGY